MNNKSLKFSIAAITAAIGMVSVTGSAQDTDDLDRKMRELNIMNNIFQAAMEESTDDGVARRRISPPRSMYLADQGMVFTFRIMNVRPVRVRGQNYDNSWMEYMNEAMEIAAETMQRVEMSFPDLDFDYDFDDLYAGVPPAAPAAPAVGRFIMGVDFDQDREAMRDMEEAMRDTQREIRDQQREIRDLERDLRNGEGEAGSIQSRIEASEALIETQLQGLEEQQQAYEAFITDLQNMRREQQQVLAEEASGQIIATLCDYGATLRSLGNNEHVTLILEDIVEDADQVYVFDFEDIRDCQSADSLKQNAVAYQMKDV